MASKRVIPKAVVRVVVPKVEVIAPKKVKYIADRNIEKMKLAGWKVVEKKAELTLMEK